MSDVPKSIVINGETITQEMVRRIEVDTESDELVFGTLARTMSSILPRIRRVTLYLHDGRVLETEVYN